MGNAATTGSVLAASGTGAAASGTIAHIFGATAIPVLTKLGAVFGFTILAATPVGWVAGSAAVAGALAYGSAKLIRSAGSCDEMLERRRERIAESNDRFDQVLATLGTTPAEHSEVADRLKQAVAAGHLTAESADRVLEQVRQGLINPAEIRLALESSGKDSR